MKHKIIPVVILLLIIGAIGGGYWYVRQNPEQVTDLQVRFGLLSEEEATGDQRVSGYIEAEEVALAAETRGRITRITADEGTFVEAGQVLVELDMALLEAQIKQAEAKVATAKAQLAKVEAGVRSEEIAKAEAAVAVAEARAAARATEWQDAVALRDNPQELARQIDAARTALELAELKVAQAIPMKDIGEAMWELGKQRVDKVEEGIDITIEIPENMRGFSKPDNVELEEELAGAAPGDDIDAHYNFKEGDKRLAWSNWNMANADMWAAWVDLNSAMAARDDAETTLNDLVRLKRDPQEAQVNVAQAEAAYQSALAEVEVAEAQLAILKAGPRAEQLALAEARVKQATAALAALNVERDKQVLVTPRAGWVVERVAHEGEMAVPGVPLLTLADLTEVTLTVYVPEPDVDTVSIGQQVNVFVDSFPGQPFSGRITYISDEAEFTPKNVQTKEERVNTVFAVKIKLDNSERLLKPGMPADAVLSKGPQL
jgi:multidrug resistance efflux pump